MTLQPAVRQPTNMEIRDPAERRAPELRAHFVLAVVRSHQEQTPRRVTRRAQRKIKERSTMMTLRKTCPSLRQKSEIRSANSGWSTKGFRVP